MKKLLFVCIQIISISFLLVISGSAQNNYWSYPIGPNKGMIHSLCNTPKGTILAGTYQNGVYRSIDNGTTWQQCTGGLNVGSVDAIVISGTDIYLGAGDGGTQNGLYLSKDDGITWESLLTSNILGLTIYGDTILAGIEGGIYTSYNRGRTWSFSPLPGRIYSVLRISKDSLIAGSSYCAYYSFDGGNNWTRSTSNFQSVSKLRQDVDMSVYADWTYGSIRSTDYGKTWENVYNGSMLVQLNKFQRSEDFLCGASDSTVYRSADNGKTWSFLASTKKDDISINCFSVLPDGTIFIGTPYDGVFKLNDNGYSYYQCGLPVLTVNSLITLGEKFIIAGTERNGMIRSSDEGKTWSRPLEEMSLINIVSLAEDDDGRLYAGEYYGYLYNSLDSGKTWNVLNTGPGNTNITMILTSRKGDLIIYTIYGLYRSTDYGVTWTKLNFDGHPGTSIRLKDGILLLGCGEGIYRSIDDGATWILPDKQPSYWQVSALAADSDGNVYAGSSEFSGRNIFISKDKGVTWNELSGWHPRSSISSIAVNAGGHIYAVMNGVLYRRKSKNEPWTKIYDESNNGKFIHALALGGSGYLYAGLSNNSGVIKTNQSTQQCLLSSYEVSMGEVHVDQTLKFYLRVRNKSDELLNLNISQNINPVIMISPLTLDVPSSDSSAIVISYTPINDDTLNTEIILQSNSNTSPDTVIVAGVGKFRRSLKIKSRQLYFYPTEAGKVIKQSLVLSNKGYDSLHISSILSASSSFRVQPLSMVIPPDDSREAEVAFNPEKIGNNQGLLVVESDSPSKRDTVLLNGLCNKRGNLSLTHLNPAEFKLYQNYPNPFNNNTVIRFAVTETSPIIVEIYDISGRFIERPINEILEAGVYEIDWRPEVISSGIYIYRFQCKNFTDTKKMILLH